MQAPFELYYVELFKRYWHVRRGIRKCIKIGIENGSTKTVIDSEYTEKLIKLDKLLSSVVADKSIKFLVKKLQYYYYFFNRLSIIFKDVSGCKKGKALKEQVEKRAKRYLSIMRTKSKTDPEFKKIVTRLEKYWQGLFYTYEFDYIPPTNNELEERIKDFKKIWKRITGFYNVNRWISFHGPFAVYLLNFQKNKQGKSSLELLGIEPEDFITMSQKVSIQTYKNEQLKQIELRESYRVRLRVNKIGIRQYVDHIVQEFDHETNILKGDDC